MQGVICCRGEALVSASPAGCTALSDLRRPPIGPCGVAFEPGCATDDMSLQWPDWISGNMLWAWAHQHPARGRPRAMRCCLCWRGGKSLGRLDGVAISAEPTSDSPWLLGGDVRQPTAGRRRFRLTEMRTALERQGPPQIGRYAAQIASSSREQVNLGSFGIGRIVMSRRALRGFSAPLLAIVLAVSGCAPNSEPAGETPRRQRRRPRSAGRP